MIIILPAPLYDYDSFRASLCQYECDTSWAPYDCDTSCGLFMILALPGASCSFILTFHGTPL